MTRDADSEAAAITVAALHLQVRTDRIDPLLEDLRLALGQAVAIEVAELKPQVVNGTTQPGRFPLGDPVAPVITIDATLQLLNLLGNSIRIATILMIAVVAIIVAIFITVVTIVAIVTIMAFVAIVAIVPVTAIVTILVPRM